jgi:ribosome biogenesis protein BRX1
MALPLSFMFKIVGSVRYLAKFGGSFFVVHTMDELHFTGNCLKGSRPILSFDASFDSQPHLQVIKEVFLHTFGVPKGSRKSKPFVDHVMGFTVAQGKIWVRCYQINETEATKQKKAVTENGENMDVDVAEKPKKGDTSVSLVEIGPRFVLTPIVILESSFGGPVIYENKEFVSPNQVRSDLKRKKAGKYNTRTEHESQVKMKLDDLGLRTDGRKNPKSPLDDQILFA